MRDERLIRWTFYSVSLFIVHLITFYTEEAEKTNADTENAGTQCWYNDTTAIVMDIKKKETVKV